MDSTSHRPFPYIAVFGASLILGTSLVISTVCASYTAYRMKAISNTISVTGSAEQTITSDVAKWTSGFGRTVGIDGLKVGYDLMKTDMEATQAYLKKAGIDEKTITIQPVTVSQTTECSSNQSNEPCNPRQTGYQLHQTFIVESNDVAKVTSVSKDAGAALADKGVLLEGSTPEYYYSKLSDLKLDMLTQATKSAKDRAEKIVQSSGAQLGTVVSAGMGVFQVTSVNSTEISDYGTYDTSSIDKKVTAVVRASFTIR